MAIHSPSTRRIPRFDVLLEPIEIGPVTARNRFFQVPHCNGMGHRDPTAHAVMRGIKAEGGWAVVCTEEVEIHPTSEVAPYAEGRLWDDDDIPALQRMTAAVHAHGSLAGIEPVHNGIHGANLWSREAPMAAGHMPVIGNDPLQVRRMSAQDIADLRLWHRRAVARSIEAGFDIVYVYASHGLNTIGQFLSHFNLKEPIGTAVCGIDFVGLARSLGCAGARVEESSELAGTLRDALQSPVPILVDVVVA